jgi:hypothetical protein
VAFCSATFLRLRGKPAVFHATAKTSFTTKRYVPLVAKKLLINKMEMQKNIQ